jgi:glycosyltransferase involved in cell wall biosynthesis
MPDVSGMITALIIAKNEAGNICPCLDSLRGIAAQAVVVVDSSSTDATAEIARLRGALVFIRPWPGYSAAKIFGLQQVTSEWVLWIDADERVTPQLAAEINRTVTTAQAAAFAMPRRAFFMDRWIKHCGWYPGYVTRLFRRERARFDGKDVHEGLVVDGPVHKLRCDLLHFTDPDLEHYLDKFNHYTGLAAEEMHRNGRRFHIHQVAIKPVAFFLKMYLLKLGLLDGIEGLILCLLSAYYVFVKYLKLWELSLGRTGP